MFFLGGQINCSTTIHNRSDILRVLSLSERNEVESVAADLSAVPPSPTTNSGRKGFFRAFRARSATKVPTLNTNDTRDVGMEQDLINKIQKLNFKNQMKRFYTAYSKVLLSHPFRANPHFRELISPRSTPANSPTSTLSSPTTASPLNSSPPGLLTCSSSTRKQTRPLLATTSSKS